MQKYISLTSNGMVDQFPIVSWWVSFAVVIDGWEESASHRERATGKLATTKWVAALKCILLATVLIQFVAE